ncbi:hypothetical protein QM201_21585 [Enterobacter asburiae]|nr:hypothetical protein [Enterobacter asburiae]
MQPCTIVMQPLHHAGTHRLLHHAAKGAWRTVFPHGPLAQAVQPYSP